MKQKLFSNVLSLVFLSMILPISADESNDKQIYLSEIEVQEIFSNPSRSYIYVGKDVSDIAHVITEISKLEEDQNSAVWGLRNHIEKGFSIGSYDAVAQALEQAELTLKKYSHTLDTDNAQNLSRSLNNIIDQVIEDKLSLDAELLSFLKDQVNVTENITRSGLRLLVINEKMHVHGKTKFYKDVTFKDDVKFKDDVTFEDDVSIEGSLSVSDQIIGCNLTVGCNISINDSVSSAIGNIVKNGVTFIHNFGTNNTFVGKGSGNFTMTGTDNSGFGLGALTADTTGIQNTAAGVSALTSNTTGSNNTALGFDTLLLNVTGMNNTAAGAGALFHNTVDNNTAVGMNALATNTVGTFNTAVGHIALLNNTTGNSNTAIGENCLTANTIGARNTALGSATLSSNTIGLDNTALGFFALPSVSTGNNNIAIGSFAGNTLTTGSNNVYIGLNAVAAGENNVTRIANIRGTTTGVADAIAVLIDSTGQLGTASSTRRVKHAIEDMADASANIYDLRPVTFVYNGDASETRQYGLVAEEADQVFPEIVVSDENGQPFTVQYHVLPVLLLNEVQKLAARVAALERIRP